MEQVPVFGEKREILGYLDRVSSAESARESFVRRTQRPHRFPADGQEILRVATTTTVEFTWGTVCSARNSEEMWTVRVLLARPSEAIADVEGFKWFAEAHGEPVRRVA